MCALYVCAGVCVCALYVCVGMHAEVCVYVSSVIFVCVYAYYYEVLHALWSNKYSQYYRNYHT